MLENKNYKNIIIKYLCRILLFLIFYHGLVRPLQININDKIVRPFIEKKIFDKKYYELSVTKHHVRITHKSGKSSFLRLSIPFGQAYFFLLFFLGFKPKILISAISLYNLILIPLYTLAVIFFINGYLILGFLVILNEGFYRLMYGSIFLLKIFNRKHFNLIFDNPKEITLLY